MQIYRDKPVRIKDLNDPGLIESALTFFSGWLEELDMSVQDASLFFLIDYEEASTFFIDLAIPSIGKKVALTNAKKYDKLIAIYQAQYDPLVNYDRTEESTHTRTPNLTTTSTTSASSTSTGSDTTTTKNNQVQTVTTTPTGYGDTVETSVAPFDTATYKPQTKTESTQKGTLTTETAYTVGNGDTSESTSGGTTTSSGSGSQSETGTDETVISSHIVGNIGVTTSQQMAEAEIALAEKMAIWKTIEQDLAAELLCQVW